MTRYRREKTVRGFSGAPTHNRTFSRSVYGTPKRSPGRAAASGFCWVGSEDSHARRASGDCQVQPTTHGRFNCLTRVSTTRRWSGAQEEALRPTHRAECGPHDGLWVFFQASRVRPSNRFRGRWWLVEATRPLVLAPRHPAWHRTSRLGHARGRRPQGTRVLGEGTVWVR